MKGKIVTLRLCTFPFFCNLSLLLFFISSLCYPYSVLPQVSLSRFYLRSLKAFPFPASSVIWVQGFQTSKEKELCIKLNNLEIDFLYSRAVVFNAKVDIRSNICLYSVFLLFLLTLDLNLQGAY